MRRYLTIARTGFILVALALSVSACKGQRAKVTLQKTQQIVAQLESLNAAKHGPAELERIKGLVSQATNQLAAGEAGEALTTAKDARTQAEQLLVRVEADEALDLWNQAERDVQVADVNALSRLDADRYNRILQIRSEANDARTNNQWRRVITLSREISQEVETGISPLKNQAEGERLRAENKLQELKSEGGPVYDPESVIDAQNMINRAIERMVDQRDYVSARGQFIEAVRLAEQGIENVQHAKGKEAIDEIENILAEALDEGARDHAPADYEQVIGLLEKMVTDFNDRLYTRVLEAADDLKPRALALKFKTKQRASDARIRTMKNDIDELVNAGAREYLPGRVETLDEKLASAIGIREENTEEAFDRIRTLFHEHEDTVSQIDREFSTLANDAIRLAGNEIETTWQVFSQLQSMFLPQLESDQPFEAARESRRVQIGQSLDSARAELDVARQRIQTRQYRQSIQIAQSQSTVANNLLGEIYRLVATNAVVELANLIARYERDGARIYAGEALDRSAADLDRVKDAINAGQYLQATELAAAARSNVDLMARQISGRAVEDIREARRVLDDVTSEKTEKYSSEALVRVRRLIGEAEQELQAERLKLAVEKANEAIVLAREAQAQANKVAAEDSIDAALSKIERAAQSGAAVFAGRELESARNLLQQAEAIYGAGGHEQAEQLAISAAERADQAYYKKVNEADAMIADAKAVGGWEHDNRALSTASAQAREARRLLDDGNFQASASLAESARESARSVANSTKQANFRAAIRRINNNLEEGRQQGINYFQVQDSVEIRQRLAELQNAWSLERYDFIMAEMMKLEGRLTGTLQSTDDIVQLVADQQGSRLDRLVEGGARVYSAPLVDRARENLKYALMDYNRGQYKSAHSALERAIADINEIQRRFDLDHYAGIIEQIFAEYSQAQYKFKNVLTLDPSELKALAFTSATRGAMVALSGQSNPNDFRADVERLYSQLLYLEPPTGMERAHASALEAINLGRIAALKFEKLVVLNEFSDRDARAIIDSGYDFINRSNQMVAKIQREFFDEEVRMRLVSAQ